jgi:LuxR family transcriptional regulator, maltose regulon positive regulatory protein
VLSREEKLVQSFLLRTSILERLSAPLCEAVLGESDDQPSDTEESRSKPQPLTPDPHSAQAMLERLERANLFVVPLDDERRW